MPELPEVQNFRRLLLPLVSKEHSLRLERHTLERAPPRRFISDDEIEEIHSSKSVVSEVLRKGKLICMVLQELSNDKLKGQQATKGSTKYLFLHMGMTGRISTPDCIPKLQELSDTDIYPPPHTYLRLMAGSNEACFSDPRKFGAIYLKDTLEDDFGILAPDAWTSTLSVKHEGQGEDTIQSPSSSMREEILQKITNKSTGIKAILLDQKRAVCGVGNWVADEVLYQTKLHPDQNYLSDAQGQELLNRLHSILDEAVGCLSKGAEFPQEWLFHYRWSKRGSNKSSIKDANGRSITFVTSGGRTSAIVPAIQKKKSQPAKKAAPSKEVKVKTERPRTKTQKLADEPRSIEEDSEHNSKRKKSSVKKEDSNTSKRQKVTKLQRNEKPKAYSSNASGGTKRRSPRLATATPT